MILRRLTTAFRKQDWFTVLIETLIVVFGVFIGIQVSNWNDARHDRARGAAYYDRLIEEFQAEEESLATRIAYYERTRQYGLAALALLDAPSGVTGDAPDDEAFLIAAYQTTQEWRHAVNRSVYDEIVSVGALNSINDPKLRRMLSSYYKNADARDDIFKAGTDYRETVRARIPYAIQLQIQENCGDRWTESEDSSVLSMNLPEDCGLKLGPDDIRTARTRLTSHIGLRAELTRHISDIDTKLTLYRYGLSRTANLRVYMETTRP